MRRSTYTNAPDIDARLRENEEWSEVTAALHVPRHRPPMTDADRDMRAWIWLSDLVVVFALIYFTFF